MCPVIKLLDMNSTGEGCIVRRLRREEFAFVIGLAYSEGWNPGVHDDDCFFAADTEGFFLAECDDEPIGTASMVCYDDTFAFFGLYIVRPELRSKGYGMQLYRSALERAGKRTWGADCVIDMVNQYEQKTPLRYAHKNIRFEGVGGGRMPDYLTPIRRVHFDSLLEYDRRHFPARRARFLRCWITRPDTEGFAALGPGGTLQGFGVRRKCMTGHKIGPLFADTPLVAEDLFAGLSAGVSGQPIFLDVPEPNAAALELAGRHGMTPVFETARMYAGPAPALPLDEIFGVTSFELG